MRRSGWTGSMFVSAILLAFDATAEPVDFFDPTPRTVEVAFEVSPRD